MSVNIAIEEGGVARQFTAAEIETKKVGGGSRDWVPKNEVRLTTKHISKNGTYPASSDGYYGFKFVTVNVPGGSGSADSSGKPSGTILPGGAGSAIVGEDEDGNDAVLGVDEQGKIVKTPIPSAIHIITPPTKTEYVEGETIIHDGLVVGLKKKDGSTFTDSRYPNGHIPLGELVFPVEVAPEPGEAGRRSTLDTSPVEQPIPIGADVSYINYNRIGNPAYIYRYSVVGGGCTLLIVFPSRYGGFSQYIIYASDNPDSHGRFEMIRYSDGTYNIDDVTELADYTYAGKTVYCRGSTSAFGGRSTAEVNGALVVLDYDPNSIGVESVKKIAWTMIYGDLTGGEANIPVQWKSPYDGKQMEDKFEIEVTGAPEGSGGGGGF